MKLLERTTGLNLLLSGALLITGFMVMYFLMLFNFRHELDERLYAHKNWITAQLWRGEFIPNAPPLIQVSKVDSLLGRGTIIDEVRLMDPGEGELEKYRQLKTYERVNGINYFMIIRQPLVETDDFLGNIISVLSVLLAILLAIYYWLNKKLYASIWHPFYFGLEQLTAFRLYNDRLPKTVSSSIQEFQQFNNVILRIAHKMLLDFNEVKAFAANASHEMQTPLTIIQSNLEQASQDSQLTKDQSIHIYEALKAVKRLSRLNKNLLMLAKIENQQFDLSQQFDLISLIRETTSDFEDVSEAKRVTCTILGEGLDLIGNRDLTKILLSNLIGNAIKYSVEDSQVSIDLVENKLQIRNMTNYELEDTKRMFERFTKWDASSQSHGLGLSIVKKICGLTEWEVHYHTKKSQHILTVSF